MNNRIVSLPQKTTDLLCAGPVITHILDIIKELVENSIDACASNISVKLINNGLRQIEIADSGKGISPAEIKYLGCKNYTSKFRENMDLDQIETFGFRGQSIYAIKAASKKITILSKVSSEKVATIAVLESSCNDTTNEPNKVISGFRDNGTTVTIEFPLSKYPVRLQEITKNQSSILSSVKVLLSKYYFLYPNIRFHLNSTSINSLLHLKNGKNPTSSFIWPASTNIEKAIENILGKEIHNTLDNFKINLVFEHNNSNFKTFLDEESYYRKNPNEILLKQKANLVIKSVQMIYPNPAFLRDIKCIIFVNKRPILQKSKDFVNLTKKITGYIISKDLNYQERQINNIIDCKNKKNNNLILAFISIPKKWVDINVSSKKNTVLITNKKILFHFELKLTEMEAENTKCASWILPENNKNALQPNHIIEVSQNIDNMFDFTTKDSNLERLDVHNKKDDAPSKTDFLTVPSNICKNEYTIDIKKISSNNALESLDDILCEKSPLGSFDTLFSGSKADDIWVTNMESMQYSDMEVDKNSEEMEYSSSISLVEKSQNGNTTCNKMPSILSCDIIETENHQKIYIPLDSSKEFTEYTEPKSISDTCKQKTASYSSKQANQSLDVDQFDNKVDQFLNNQAQYNPFYCDERPFSGCINKTLSISEYNRKNKLNIYSNGLNQDKDINRINQNPQNFYNKFLKNNSQNQLQKRKNIELETIKAAKPNKNTINNNIDTFNIKSANSIKSIQKNQLNFWYKNNQLLDSRFSTIKSPQIKNSEFEFCDMPQSLNKKNESINENDKKVEKNKFSFLNSENVKKINNGLPRINISESKFGSVSKTGSIKYENNKICDYSANIDNDKKTIFNIGDNISQIKYQNKDYCEFPNKSSPFLIKSSIQKNLAVKLIVKCKNLTLKHEFINSNQNIKVSGRDNHDNLSETFVSRSFYGITKKEYSYFLARLKYNLFQNAKKAIKNVKNETEMLEFHDFKEKTLYKFPCYLTKFVKKTQRQNVKKNNILVSQKNFESQNKIAYPSHLKFKPNRIVLIGSLHHSVLNENISEIIREIRFNNSYLDAKFIGILVSYNLYCNNSTADYNIIKKMQNYKNSHNPIALLGLKNILVFLDIRFWTYLIKTLESNLCHFSNCYTPNSKNTSSDTNNINSKLLNDKNIMHISTNVTNFSYISDSNGTNDIHKDAFLCYTEEDWILLFHKISYVLEIIDTRRGFLFLKV
ncbi:hypothetical protein BB561_003618 [Smittium simulii]|uniref:DNA mismatch repair protein S5 domain-containing protein n=1 Tax=Smittium simulii TaxID=133385 RepID=A0A2T9YKD5_9FUNG|nr:hypothetical protein BB561_003618 [Smittium simulii]